ncbi:AI-2E family transporter [Alicyclobacillus sp.]|uniref:AI-2E family transporter n=1 Tax=Alicyclobacillus sp. TaxID=61169 RepID=UPI0025C717D5|nr:AI-2E family transporter [Alicyclobacillus sp.]MCL6515962.1 AI-2E family transporter [Alicyclobacillus sp.]
MDASTKYLRTVLSVLATLACLWLIAQLRGFLYDLWLILKVVAIPFLAAMVVTYLLQPVVDLLVRRRVPRGAAILIIYLTFAVVAVVLILQAIPVVSRQLTQLGQHLPDMIRQADGWIDGIAQRRQYLPDALRRGVETALNQAEQNVTAYVTRLVSMLTSTVAAVFMAFVVPFLVFYMLKDGRALGRALLHLFPRRYRDEAREILMDIDTTLGRYVRGQMLVMAAVGVLTYAGYLVVGMPYALLLALFLAVMDVIPYLGPFIGAAPAILLALTVSPPLALKVLLVNAIVQQLEGNLIQPQIMGRTLDLHPMAIVAAVLIGGEVGGVLGLVCAVPLLAVAKVVYTGIRSLFRTP